MSITDVAHKIDSTYREMEEDLRVMIDTWHGYIWLMADTKEPQTEINQQFKLVNDYRKLVENIKVKHINTFKQIEEELQPKNVQQHQAEIYVRSNLDQPTWQQMIHWIFQSQSNGKKFKACWMGGGFQKTKPNYMNHRNLLRIQIDPHVIVGKLG